MSRKYHNNNEIQTFSDKMETTKYKLQVYGQWYNVIAIHPTGIKTFSATKEEKKSNC
jgi:hypothetical protein